jgi:L-threonylcarbamoyladenylate synthase
LKTEIEVVVAQEPDELEHAGKRAAETLAAGGLVVHPTETVYGIGGACTPEVNRLVSRVKQRETGQALIALTPGLEALQGVCSALEWPPEADALATRFWPGPLTLIVRCHGAPPGLPGASFGVAVRQSPHPVVVAMMNHWGRLMTSTSANLAGAEPARTLDRALSVFAGRDDLDDFAAPILAIDAGVSRETRASTIVSLIESPPRLVREGPVSFDAIDRCLAQLS